MVFFNVRIYIVNANATCDFDLNCSVYAWVGRASATTNKASGNQVWVQWLDKYGE